MYSLRSLHLITDSKMEARWSRDRPIFIFRRPLSLSQMQMLNFSQFEVMKAWLSRVKSICQM